jgi:ribose/xylose/arabinose/galactoside ABC-type transport system permease subunit
MGQVQHRDPAWRAGSEHGFGLELQAITTAVISGARPGGRATVLATLLRRAHHS